MEDGNARTQALVEGIHYGFQTVEPGDNIRKVLIVQPGFDLGEPIVQGKYLGRQWLQHRYVFRRGGLLSALFTHERLPSQ